MSENARAIHDLIHNYYENKPYFGNDMLLMDIESFLRKEFYKNENYPLIIAGDQGAGKTHFLTAWLQQHQNQMRVDNTKDYYLVHFAGTRNPDMSHFPMREFGIQQKIELSQEKLRIFFSEWLQIANDRNFKKNAGKATIYLIIDGINLFEDPESPNESTFQNIIEELPDWMPKEFPGGFRVVISLNSNSHSLKFFQKRKYPILKLPTMSMATAAQIIAYYFRTQESPMWSSAQRRKQLSEQVLSAIQQYSFSFKTPQVLIIFLHLFYPTLPRLYTLIRKQTSIEEFLQERILSIEWLFLFSLKQFESEVIESELFRRLFCLLLISHEGLSLDNIHFLLSKRCQIHQIQEVLRLFSFALLKLQNRYLLLQQSFAKVIRKEYMPTQTQENELHLKIYKMPSSMKPSVSLDLSHQLDSCCYHLFCAKEWLRLKDVVSRVEHFAQFYRTETLYYLALYWEKLERSGFDPVQEYNKVIESFVTNFLPSNKELFVIIKRVAQFLYDLAALETKLTPEFRHPPLQGEKELLAIGLLYEFKKLSGMYSEQQNCRALREEENVNGEKSEARQLYYLKNKDIKADEPIFQEPSQYYYYKRWLWLQFPWLCINIESKFSTQENYQEAKEREIEREFGITPLRKASTDADELSNVLKDARQRKCNLFKQHLQDMTHQTRRNSVSVDISGRDIQTIQSLESSQPKLKSVRSQAPLSPLSTKTHVDSSRGGSRTQRNQKVASTTQRFLSGERTGRGTSRSPQFKSPLKTGGAGSTQKVEGCFSKGSSPSFDEFWRQKELRSEYERAKKKLVEQDFGFSTLTGSISPLNVLNKISEKVHKYGKKEKEHLEHCNLSLIRAYNHLVDMKKQKEKKLKSEQLVHQAIAMQLNFDVDAEKRKYIHLQAQIQQAQKNYEESQLEQERLRQVYLVCYRNKTNCEEWVRQLERGSKNISLMIFYETQNLKNFTKQEGELRKQNREFQMMVSERTEARMETIDRVKLHFNINLHIKQRHALPGTEQSTRKSKSKLVDLRNSKILEEDSKDLESSNPQSPNSGEISPLSSSDNSPRKRDKSSSRDRSPLEEQMIRNREKTMLETIQSYSKGEDTGPRMTEASQTRHEKTYYEILGQFDYIKKFKQIQMASGVNTIEEYPMMLQFLEKPQKLKRNKEELEEKVAELRKSYQEQKEILKVLKIEKSEEEEEDEEQTGERREHTMSIKRPGGPRSAYKSQSLRTVLKQAEEQSLQLRSPKRHKVVRQWPTFAQISKVEEKLRKTTLHQETLREKIQQKKQQVLETTILLMHLRKKLDLPADVEYDKLEEEASSSNGTCMTLLHKLLSRCAQRLEKMMKAIETEYGTSNSIEIRKKSTFKQRMVERASLPTNITSIDTSIFQSIPDIRQINKRSAQEQNKAAKLWKQATYLATSSSRSLSRQQGREDDSICSSKNSFRGSGQISKQGSFTRQGTKRYAILKEHLLSTDKKIEEKKSIQKSWIEFNEFKMKHEQKAKEYFELEIKEREKDQNYRFHQVCYIEAKHRKIGSQMPVQPSPKKNSNIYALVSPRMKRCPKIQSPSSPYGLIENQRKMRKMSHHHFMSQPHLETLATSRKSSLRSSVPNLPQIKEIHKTVETNYKVKIKRTVKISRVMNKLPDVFSPRGSARPTGRVL